MATPAEPAAPSAVCVFGAAAWSSSINGEYLRTELQDGRPVYQKPDASKFLAYNSQRRSWQFSRSLQRGGSYATCPGKEALDPTALNSCTMGMHTNHPIHILELPLPGELLVQGAAARGLGIQGLFCLHSDLSFRLASRPCHLGPAEGDVFLSHSHGFWNFTSNSTRTSLASCRSNLLRPDRLAAECFGSSDEELSVAPGCVRQAPLSLEVGGPNGPAGHLRGEYRRAADHLGRPSYVKPGASMVLFYSHELGGWQLSPGTAPLGAARPAARSRFALAQAPGCACTPEQLRNWQVLNDQGQLQELPLALAKPPLPSWLVFLGWPRSLRLSGDYYLMPNLDYFGRPSYTLHLSKAELLSFCWRSGLSCSASKGGKLAVVSFDFSSAQWQLVLGEVLAASEPDLALPTGGEWHLLTKSACVPSSLRMLEEQPAPAALLVFGWDGMLNGAVNGEYLRRPSKGRPSYAKADGSVYLFYNEAQAAWTIAQGLDGPVLAACRSQPHTRDPSRLPRCWTVAVTSAALQVEALPLPSRLQIHGEAMCAGTFRLAASKRPLYREEGGCRLSYLDGCWTLEDAAATWRACHAVPRPEALEGANSTWAGPTGSSSIRLWRLADGALTLHVASDLPALAGAYLRASDEDGRPSYRRTETETEILLRYSNSNGDWRFEGKGALLAFSAEVNQRRPELVASWRVPAGLRFQPLALSITAGAATRLPVILLLALALAHVL